jgi:hypothetical protein
VTRAALATIQSNATAGARAKMHAMHETMDHSPAFSLQVAERAPDRNLPDKFLEGKGSKTDFAQAYHSPLSMQKEQHP